MLIDPHVHLRDWQEKEKETLQHAFTMAWDLGFSGIFEMPNTKPALTSIKNIKQRIKDADLIKQENNIPIFHGIYAGLTSDEQQIEEVVSAWHELFPRVVGFKLYASHSTGCMGIIDSKEQLKIWQKLSELNYTGIVAIHAEKQQLFSKIDINNNIANHDVARPKVSEICSIQTNVSFAESAKFKGCLHICHASTYESAQIVKAERNNHSFDLKIGVTPHHLLLSSDMCEQNPEKALAWKVNPPIRNEQERSQLMQEVLNNNIDWLESDHAPHTWQDKLDGASGMPGLAQLRLLIDVLNKSNLPQEQLDQWTSANIIKTFKMDPNIFPYNDNANKPFNYNKYRNEYEWDPYVDILDNLLAKKITL